MSNIDTWEFYNIVRRCTYWHRLKDRQNEFIEFVDNSLDVNCLWNPEKFQADMFYYLLAAFYYTSKSVRTSLLVFNDFHKVANMFALDSVEAYMNNEPCPSWQQMWNEYNDKNN